MISRLIELSGIDKNALRKTELTRHADAKELDGLVAQKILVFSGHAQQIWCPECGKHFAIVTSNCKGFIGSCESENVTTFEIDASELELYRLDLQTLFGKIAASLKLKEKISHVDSDLPLWSIGSYTGTTASIQVYFLYAPLNEVMVNHINTHTFTHAAIIATNISYANNLRGIKKTVNILDFEQQFSPKITQRQITVCSTYLDEIANNSSGQPIYFDGSKLYVQQELACTLTAGGPTAAFIQSLYNKMFDMQGVSYEKIYAACNAASKRGGAQSKDFRSFCQTKLSEVRKFAGKKSALVDKIIHKCKAPDGKDGYIMGLSET